jgi:hypothetical protein
MDDKNLTIRELTGKTHELVKSKGWHEKDTKRPHAKRPRNLAVSLSIEAAEILEHFQFGDEIKDKDELGSELKKIEANKTGEWDKEN